MRQIKAALRRCNKNTKPDVRVKNDMNHSFGATLQAVDHSYAERPLKVANMVDKRKNRQAILNQTL